MRHDGRRPERKDPAPRRFCSTRRALGVAIGPIRAGRGTRAANARPKPVAARTPLASHRARAVDHVFQLFGDAHEAVGQRFGR